MNEERKQELTQLLNEAMEDLEILPRFTDPPLTPVSIDRYKGVPTGILDILFARYRTACEAV